MSDCPGRVTNSSSATTRSSSRRLVGPNWRTGSVSNARRPIVLSVPATNVAAMNEGRKRRQAKQARRDTRRRATNHRQTPERSALMRDVRAALDAGHPLDLLVLVSTLIEAVTPDRLAFRKAGQRQRVCLKDLIAGFVGTQIRETTALLAVLSEFLVDDEELQRICAQEVANRPHRLPRWIAGLPGIQVRRVARMAHLLGDSDELLIGARLIGGQELTCVVRIDHNVISGLDDAFVVADSIDKVRDAAVETNTDPDVSFVEMTLADTRAWIQHGLVRTAFPRLSESWANCRPLVRWLIGHMPEGGHAYERPCDDWLATSRLLKTFFTSPQGRPFNRFDHEELLAELLDAGCGDPLRWSVGRVQQALGGLYYLDDHMPVECVLDAPDLLRAFIPVAHALSGIREQLTARALDMIGEMEPAFQRRIVAEAKRWDDELWAG